MSGFKIKTLLGITDLINKINELKARLTEAETQLTNKSDITHTHNFLNVPKWEYMRKGLVTSVTGLRVYSAPADGWLFAQAYNGQECSLLFNQISRMKDMIALRNETTNYKVGDLIRTTKNEDAVVYQCIKAHTNQVVTSTTYWKKIEDWTPSIYHTCTSNTSSNDAGCGTILLPVSEGTNFTSIYVGDGAAQQININGGAKLYVKFIPYNEKDIGKSIIDTGKTVAANSVIIDRFIGGIAGLFAVV